MRLLRLFLVLLPGLALAAGPPVHPYADPVRRRIATAQDERNTDALVPFLTDKNPTYRAAAAEALASVQDRAAVPELLPLLRDATPAVRRAAAYALGQAGDSTAVAGLSNRLMQPETSALVRRTTYEALGRCVTKSTVALLWDITLPCPDSAAAPGRAWAIYRASLRGLATAEAVQEASKLLDKEKQVLPARQGASAALTRMRGQDSTLARVARVALLKALSSDPDYFVRANCATALGRVARPSVSEALLMATTDADFRVRIASVRALPATYLKPSRLLAAIEREQSQPLAQEALVASEWLLKSLGNLANPNRELYKGHGEYMPVTGGLKIEDFVGFAVASHRIKHFRARATLLQAALRHAPAAQRPALADTIRRRYQRTTNQYEKAALLTALSEDPAQFGFLAEQARLTTGPAVVPGTALAALVALRGNKDFPAARQADFIAALRGALAGGDVAQLSTVAEAYADPKLVPAPQPADLDALRQAQAKLTLPQEIEPWIALQQTLDKLEKAPTPTPLRPGLASQHPIDWEMVQRVPVGQRVRLATTQGTIELELKVAEAPGAAANFAMLVSKHFYDGLYFHRVVPNFVAQGGDPRGDGSGSTPYTLRSEFAQLNYGAGAVGLASAGKDTESCQFFITHLPTPHLDGRYPIFAQVVSGLDAVQRLDVGDRILTATLLASSPTPATQAPKKK